MAVSRAPKSHCYGAKPAIIAPRGAALNWVIIVIKTVSSKIAINCQRSGVLDHLNDEQLFRASGIHRYELLKPMGRIDASRHFRFLQLMMKHQPDIQLPEEPGLQHLFEDFLPLA